MSNQSAPRNTWEVDNKRNIAHLRNWTLSWVAACALAAFGPKFIWDFNTLLTVLAVLINLGIGFGMIAANRRYLIGLDEMQRKIFLDAAALSLGVGLVCASAYELLEDIKLISFEPEISHVIILMSLTFFVTLVWGNKKYQ